ncbi:MAG: hypothetical protein Tsb0020_31930 [Haliangiales bacterium]
MRVLNKSLFALIVLFAAGCPNKQLHQSIEEMNEGIMQYQNGAYAVALQHFTEATRVYPDNHAAWYYLGVGRRQARDAEGAAEAFAEAVKLKKDDPMYQMLHGVALYEAEKYTLAESYLAKAIEIEPNLFRAYWYLGSIYANSDRPEQAATMWTQAITLNSEWGSPVVSLGKLYLRWDMVTEALSVLEHGTKYVRGDELADVYYYLGLAYDADKNWDKAIEAYTQSVEQSKLANRDNVEATFQRGLVYLRKGDTERAQPDLEEASKASADPFTKQEANKALMSLVPTTDE